MGNKEDKLVSYIYDNYYNEILEMLVNEDEEITGWEALSAKYIRTNDDRVKLILYVTVNADEVAFEDWTLGITFVLNDGISNFKSKIMGKEIIAYGYNPTVFVNKYLLPHISKTEYSYYAEEFLKLYYPEALENNIPLNVPIILKRMGLKVEYVVTDETYEGKILFDEEVVNVVDFQNKKLVSKSIPSGTVLINLNCEKISKNLLCINSIVMHECIHWWLHRKYFTLLKLFDPNFKAFIDEDIKKIDKEKFKNKYFAELQARSIAPIVLANDNAVKSKYSEIIEKLQNRKSYHSKEKTYFHAMYKLANHFRVSPSCALIRLKSLGFTELEFAKQLGRCKGLKPFSSSAELESGQTYLLELKDAIHAINRNPTIKKLIREGMYLYIDGLFILNNDNYVHHYKNGKVKIKKEALSDVSKCCLLFSTKVDKVEIEHDPLKLNVYSLYSGEKNNSYHRDAYLNIYEQPSINCIVNQFKEDIDESKECIKVMDGYDTFHEKLDNLIVYLGYKSHRSVANLCEIDSKTIKDYRTGKTKPDEKNMMKIIGGLQLKPKVSKYLLVKANRDFTNNIEDPYPLYDILINTCYNHDLDTWRIYIKEVYPNNPEFML